MDLIGVEWSLASDQRACQKDKTVQKDLHIKLMEAKISQAKGVNGNRQLCEKRRDVCLQMLARNLMKWLTSFVAEMLPIIDTGSNVH